MDIGLGRSRLILMVMAIFYIAFYIAYGASAGAQTRPQQKPKMAEDVFTNVQVLRGIPVDQFMGTMGFFSASLGLNCIDCHSAQSANSLEGYATDTRIKETARKMILMMTAIDQTYFAGQRVVTCYSCHRGIEQPKISPSLAEMYATPPPADANETDLLEKPIKGDSAADIIDKYIQAIGGSQNLSKLSSFVGKGTYQGFDTESESNPKVPFEVFAQAPGKRATVVHLSEGDLITAYDGQSAWKSGPKAVSPLPFMQLTGGELDGVQLWCST
jgi:photosynthetic reaction center cytochrome c subunit